MEGRVHRWPFVRRDPTLWRRWLLRQPLRLGRSSVWIVLIVWVRRGFEYFAQQTSVFRAEGYPRIRVRAVALWTLPHKVLSDLYDL